MSSIFFFLVLFIAEAYVSELLFIEGSYILRYSKRKKKKVLDNRGATQMLGVSKEDSAKLAINEV